jgi:hypothetical protein
MRDSTLYIMGNLSRDKIYYLFLIRGATPQTSHKQAIADINRGMGVNYRRYDS